MQPTTLVLFAPDFLGTIHRVNNIGTYSFQARSFFGHDVVVEVVRHVNVVTLTLLTGRGEAGFAAVDRVSVETLVNLLSQVEELRGDWTDGAVLCQWTGEAVGAGRMGPQTVVAGDVAVGRLYYLHPVNTRCAASIVITLKAKYIFQFILFDIL